MTRFACKPPETSCLLSNLFTELRPVCGRCEGDNVVLRGLTYEGEEQTVVLRDYGFDYSGRRETVERIRKRRCINGNPEKLSAEGEWVYNELKRGRYTHRNSDWTEEERYSPDIAEAAYREHLAAKGPDLKIGKDYRLAEYIERRIVEDGYSPAAVLGEIKVKGIQFNTTICEATLYSYIKKGVFLTLEMVHLPCKGKQKRPYTKVKKNKKAARASAGKSIEKRDPEIDTREEVGHWEMDCVEGKKKTKETLLVLSERKARKEIMIKMKDQTAGSVVAALDRLERRYGTLFYKIFQTITVDNGSEFADVEGLERSCRRKGKRTTVFYCHPYSSYERGTNENINRMIRRWFPKGTDFGQVPKKAIQAVEDWLNAYPREILGFRSADEVFAEGLAALG